MPEALFAEPPDYFLERDKFLSLLHPKMHILLHMRQNAVHQKKERGTMEHEWTRPEIDQNQDIDDLIFEMDSWLLVSQR